MIPQGVLTYSSTTYIPRGFIVEFTLAGDGESITLPLVQTRSEGALSYDCMVDWGDSSTPSHITAWNDAAATHIYSLAGVYQVSITGTMEGWSFNNSGDYLKCTDIIYWGDSSLFNGFKYLANGFYNCLNLKSLGTGKILASGTGVLLDGFQRTFEHCELITYITKGLFDNHPNVTDNAFDSTFSFTAITTIPRHLFDVHTNALDWAFNGTFGMCLYLAIIPNGLFNYNTKVRKHGFEVTFEGCSSLLMIPNFLHRYNTACRSFAGEFNECINLTLNPWVFYAPGEETTRFGSSTASINFGMWCSRTTFSGMQGAAPELWNCFFNIPPTTSGCFGDLGNSLVSLSNYASIPSGWK